MQMISKEIIHKYIDGRATVSEADRVDNWRDQSLENELKFQELESFYLTGKWPEGRVDVAEKVKFWKNRYFLIFTCLLVVSYGIAVIVTSQRVFKTKVGSEDTLLIFEDVANIQLAKGSELIYPEDFNGSYNKVFLSGKAYFSVSARSESFIIDYSGSRIEVVEFPSTFSVSPLGIDSIQLIVDLGEVVWDCESDRTELKPAMAAIWDIKNNQFYTDFNFFRENNKKSNKLIKK